MVLLVNIQTFTCAVWCRYWTLERL